MLGHADVHVHISATTFLGGAHWGLPYHKFGVEHAIGDCSALHGDTGQLDLVGGVFTQDPDGHATDGWPTFTEWPSRDNLTHEAIYWKWVERAWAGGLRVIVNDLVDNETLCELHRNAVNEPTRDCNSMNTAGQQVGTMYGMQDYIDAQYGGRGKGFFQIVHDPDEARTAIENGHVAVVLGIEISELFNCKLNYSPLRQQRPFEEDGVTAGENSYTCTMEEGQPNSILTQMQRIHDWGVRQVISIHEFDNAFGGNGIFDGLILNQGNREDTGGIPSGDNATMTFLRERDLSTLPLPPDLGATLLTLLGAPNIASKRAVYRRYDHLVGSRPVRRPGLDAAVLRHEAVATNIANAETPQYFARDYDFKDVLARALRPVDPRRDGSGHLHPGPRARREACGSARTGDGSRSDHARAATPVILD